MKQTHVARAEAAAVRREEKRRIEKERILSVSCDKIYINNFIYICCIMFNVYDCRGKRK